MNTNSGFMQTPKSHNRARQHNTADGDHMVSISRYPYRPLQYFANRSLLSSLLGVPTQTISTSPTSFGSVVR